MVLPPWTWWKSPLKTQWGIMRWGGWDSVGITPIFGEGNGNLLLFSTGESHGQRSLASYSPWDRKSWTWPSDWMTITTSIPISGTNVSHKMWNVPSGKLENSKRVQGKGALWPKGIETLLFKLSVSVLVLTGNRNSHPHMRWWRGMQ